MSYWVKILIKKNPTILKNIRTIFTIKYLLSDMWISGRYQCQYGKCHVIIHIFSGIRVTRSLVLCVCFVDRCYIRTIFTIKYLLSGSYSSFFCDLAGKNFWAGTDWAPLPASPESPATFYPPVTTPIIVSDYFLVLSHILYQYVRFCMPNNSRKSVSIICPEGQYRYSPSKTHIETPKLNFQWTIK
jgi:hypothetical protein